MNKKYFFLVLIIWVQCFIFTSFQVSAQKIKSDEVPADVIQTLDFEQAGVKVSQWTLENGVYCANFKSDGAPATMYIKADGTYISTTYQIPKNSLPSAITDYVKSNYPLFVISVSETREMPGINMFYYIEVRPEQVGALPSVLTFDNMGKLLSRDDPEGFKIPEDNLQYAAATAPKSNIEDSDNQKNKKSSSTKPAPTKAPAKAPKSVPEKPVKKEKPKKTEELSSAIAPTGAESLAPSAVPTTVQKALTKKIQRPTDLRWYKNENQYIATCSINEIEQELYFSKEGVWKNTFSKILEEQLPQNILKHLTNYYKGYKFVSAIKEMREDKQDKILVEIIEKKNSKTKLISALIFDKMGKFLKIYEPNNADDAEITGNDRLNTKNITEVSADIPNMVVSSFKAKYPKINGVEFSESADGYFYATYFGVKGKEIVVLEGNGNIIEIRTAANLGNINTNIADFVKKNLKGYKIIEYYAVRGIIEKKNTYLIVVFNKKTQESQNFSFTTGGKLIQ